MNKPTATDTLYPELTPISESCHWATLSDDPMITLIALRDAHRATIDAWVDFGIELREEWPEGQMLLILVDLADSDFSFTRYATKRAQDMMTVRPDIDERVAVIVPSTALGRLIEVSMQLANRMARVGINVFKTREEAVAWLQQEHAQVQAQQLPRAG